MNPFFQNQQFGYPNQGTYYGYNQNNYQNYGYTSPTQSIEAMYTTVHPYNNKQFLLSTFGNKPEYISIFLTLCHQDKLKMYMLMEQKKLYGEMSDKEAYQKILKQIAQKIQNFNLFHSADSNKKNTENKSKQLESKIDLIVQKTFQKLNLVQSPRVKNPSETKEQQLDDQEEWVQSTQISQIQKQNNRNMPKSSTLNEMKSMQNQASNPIFNMFTFDNRIQEAMTHQIGLKTINELQKKSIWQLQVDQFQIKQQEPNFKQIFKVKSSSQQKPKENNTVKQITETSQNNIQRQQMTQPIQNRYQSAAFSMNAASIYDFYKINSPRLQALINNTKQQQQQDFNNFMTTDNQYSNFIQNNLDLNNIMFKNSSSIQKNANQQGQGQGANIIQNINIQRQQAQEQNFVQQEQEFQFAQTNLQNVSQTKPQQNQQIINQQLPNTQVVAAQQPDTNNLNYQSMLFDSVQIQTPSPSLQFNFLQALTSPRSKYQNNFQIPQNSQINKAEEIEEIGQTLFQSQVFSQTGIPQNQQIIYPVSQKNLQTNPLDLIRSSLSTHGWQNQELLKKLKIEMSEQDKTSILKRLTNKSFQCNPQFYLLIINYLRQISLQWSPEYRHFTQQCKIVKELHQQSQRYTTAVDQSQQQKVTLMIRKTKQLLNTIYENSSKTQKYVRNLLDDKCEQKGLLYKFGHILFSSSVGSEILQKVINQDKKQILKSFNVLYIIEKLSSIQKLRFFSQKIMIYLGLQYQKYKKIDEQSLRQVQNQEQSYPKYIVFAKGFVKICGICERMINLLKFCCVKTNFNTVKLLKICKDIKIKYSQYDQYSKKSTEDLEDLQEVIKTSIQRNKSVYDLHSEFFKHYKAQPVCGLCFRKIKNDGNLIQEIYYHYSCFNLSSHLQKQVQHFTQ